MDFQEDTSNLQEWGAQCAWHPSARAMTICSRCGSYACARCQRVGEDGLEYCFSCVSLVEEALAERWDRFLANLVDQVIIFLPWFGSVGLATVIAGHTPRGEPLSRAIGLLGLLGSLGIALYQLFLVGRSGQTIGKRMRNMRVVRMDGSPVTMGRVLMMRNVIPWLLGSLCGLVSLIDALFIFREDRRCLHDWIADTKVIKVQADR